MKQLKKLSNKTCLFYLIDEVIIVVLRALASELRRVIPFSWSGVCIIMCVYINN